MYTYMAHLCVVEDFMMTKKEIFLQKSNSCKNISETYTIFCKKQNKKAFQNQTDVVKGVIKEKKTGFSRNAKCRLHIMLVKTLPKRI